MNESIPTIADDENNPDHPLTFDEGDDLDAVQDERTVSNKPSELSPTAAAKNVQPSRTASVLNASDKPRYSSKAFVSRTASNKPSKI